GAGPPGSPVMDQEDSGILLAITTPTDRQPAPVPRLPQELPFRIEDDGLGPDGGGDDIAQAPVLTAIVSRALPAVDGASPDARAGGGGIDAGDAVEVDPAGGDQGRDRLRHAGAAVATGVCPVVPGADPRVAAGAPGGAGGGRVRRLGAGQVP